MKNLITSSKIAFLILSIAGIAKAQCPTITITPVSATLACATTPVTFTANTTPSTNVSYMWTQPGGNTPLAGQYCTPGAPGIYTFSATHNISGCTTTQTVQVYSNGCIPNVSVTAQNNNWYITCVTCVTLQAASVLTGSCAANVGIMWTNAAGTATLSTSPTYTTCTPGNVRLYSWNMASPSCSVSQLATVLMNTLVPTPTFSSNVWGTNSPTLTCTNPCVVLTGSSTATSYSVDWQNPTSNFSNTISICTTTNTSQTSVANPTLQIIDLVNGCAKKIVVPVYQNITPPTLSVSSNPTILCVGQTGTLTASGSATNYTWSTGSNNASIVVSPTVPTNYTVSNTNSTNGCTSSVVFSVTNCSGIASLSANGYAGIKLFPNPNNGNFNFEANGIENATLQLLNILGEIVYSTALVDGNNNIDVTNLPKGLYHYVLIENKQPFHSGKLIIE